MILNLTKVLENLATFHTCICSLRKCWCLEDSSGVTANLLCSLKKKTGSWTIKLWYKHQHYTTSNIVTPNKHCHYKLNDILETSTLAPLVFYLFQITVFIYLSRALYDYSPDCSDSYGDDLCCHSYIMFPIIVLCLKNIRTQGARQGVITLTARSYKSIYSLGGKKWRKKKKLIRLQKKNLQSQCKLTIISMFNQ